MDTLEIAHIIHAVPFLLIGMGLTVVGAIIIGGAYNLWLEGKRTVCTVKSVRRSLKGETPMYSPVLEYTDNRGQKIEALAKFSTSSITSLIPGSKMVVFINPKKPTECNVSLFFWWILVVFGILFFCLGLLLMDQAFAGLTFKKHIVLIALLAIGLAVIKMAQMAHAYRDSLKQNILTASTMATDETWQTVSPEDIERLSQSATVNTKKTAPILLLLGLVLIPGGCFWGIHVKTIVTTYTPVDGVVAKNKIVRSADAKHSISYTAEVSFKDQNGQSHLFADNTSNSSPSFEVGEKVRVLVDPTNVNNAIVDRGLMNWFGPILTFLMGVFVLVLGMKSLDLRHH